MRSVKVLSVLLFEGLIALLLFSKFDKLYSIIVSCVIFILLFILLFRDNLPFLNAYTFIRRFFLAEKRKHLYLPIIGLCIITLMLFLFLGSNTIMIYHQTVLINEKEYTAGHIQVKTYLNGLNYASELDNWTTLFSNSITSKFNESKFPATISQVDILLFVKIQVDFYFFDNKSNIVPTVANSYLVVSSGILWQKLLDLSQVNQNDMPNFITFSHNITLSEDPDIGNGFNHSFYDPFVLSSYPRLIRINKTANIHLETYKEMTDFQKQWDLPLSPGYLLFCNFSFFQELFKGEKLILEPQFERIAYVEWRGYFKTGNISLQRFEYAYYYDKLQLLIRDTISSSDLISIESPFIDDYSSSIILLNDFRYLSVIILVPLLLFGLFILFLPTLLLMTALQPRFFCCAQGVPPIG